jgi:hypothetical protein
MPTAVYIGSLDRGVRPGQETVELDDKELNGRVGVVASRTPAPLYGAYWLSTAGVEQLIEVLNTPVRRDAHRRAPCLRLVPSRAAAPARQQLLLFRAVCYLRTRSRPAASLLLILSDASVT